MGGLLGILIFFGLEGGGMELLGCFWVEVALRAERVWCAPELGIRVLGSGASIRERKELSSLIRAVICLSWTAILPSRYDDLFLGKNYFLLLGLHEERPREGYLKTTKVSTLHAKCV